MEDGDNLTENVNQALQVLPFTLHTGLKKTPFELHHQQKPRAELTNIVKDSKTYLSELSKLSISAPLKPKIPIYVGRDADCKLTNDIVIPRTKWKVQNHRKRKKNSVSYPFKFEEKTIT